MVIQVASDELWSRRVLADDVNDIFTREVSGLAKERLLAVVVIRLVVLKLPCNVAVRPERVVSHLCRHVRHVGDRPTCERSGTLFNVFFCVVAHAHSEQLENFSSVVLVDVVLVIILVIQPQDHRRVFG